MTGCPQRWESCSANSRALRSDALPTGTGAIKRTVRCGQSRAATAEHEQAMAQRRRPTAATERLELFTAFSSSKVVSAIVSSCGLLQDGHIPRSPQLRATTSRQKVHGLSDRDRTAAFLGYPGRDDAIAFWSCVRARCSEGSRLADLHHWGAVPRGLWLRVDRQDGPYSSCRCRRVRRGSSDRCPDGFRESLRPPIAAPACPRHRTPPQ